MSTEKSDQEPSMEEILSSIRRIIADDEDEAASTKPAMPDPAKAKKSETKPPAASPPAADHDDDEEDDDVLDLTQVVEPGNAAGKRDRFARSEPFDSAADEIELEPEDDDMEEEEPAVRVKPKPARPVAEQAMRDDDTLVSSATAARSTGALAKLTRAAASREPAALAHGDKTVETFLVELLRPMLKEWLDANLETVVERVVEQEVKKLARRAELM